jgi:hypothetical protein
MKFDDLVDDVELGDFWGVSARMVRELARRKIIKRVSPGRYRRDEATRAYVNHLRDVIFEKHGHFA